MSAISDLSDIVSIATGSNKESLWFFKNARVAGAAPAAAIAGRLISLWEYDGSPSGGVPPTTVAAPDNTTTGGLKQSDPGGGREKWLISGTAAANVAGTLWFYDRLLHIGSLSGTSAVAQTVGGTLTRYTDGVGNEIYIEIYTQIGATPQTVTASYTNTAGTSGRTTQAVAIGGTGLREAQRLIKLPLQAGDTGVQAVASVTLSASTGTAGNFGVVVGHPLMQIGLGVGGCGDTVGLLTSSNGPEEIQTDACLAMYFMTPGTTAPDIHGGNLFMVEK